MKCLIVTTHPLEDSLCRNLTDYVVSYLKEMEQDVVLEDLYAQRFDPVLSIAERESYYGEKFDASEIERYSERLKAADVLVLLFPTWWFSFPAMLKGWFDRVWSPGNAYDHASDLGAITSRLNNLKHVLVVTTLGSPWWVDRLVMRQPVKRVLKLALLGTCAKKSKLRFLSLYNSEKLNTQKVTKYKQRIKKELLALLRY